MLVCGSATTMTPNMIQVEQALEIIQRQIVPLPAEAVSLDLATGRILVEDCIADHDLPPFARATMDGYALRSEDAAGVPARLELAGEIAAGEVYRGEVTAGKVVRIMTGAPLPAGADSVQRVESTELDGAIVTILEPVRAGQFVTPQGSEARRGKVILRRGQRLFAAEIAALATFGYSRPRVARAPRVAVLSTGSELVATDEQPGPGQIRNSNAYAIASSAERLGCIAHNLGTVGDNETLLTQALSRAFDAHDVVITSGGVSMGLYDLVKPALKNLGVEVCVEKVALKPGKPVVFGRHGNKCFFGLPGNPVSTLVTFDLFVRPALLKMMGALDPLLKEARAILRSRAKPAPQRTSYLPGRLRYNESQLEVETLKWAGSSDLAGFVSANCFIVLSPGETAAEPGETVRVVLLEP